ncbi:hypothetical protein GCM10010124_26210 [Pilimelia terevasa]|uniref:Uncharacterized protein n=1 Tax=Pilimelia terevasa TaxID=53372 RepID=A0A8J3FI63_9ACTN|nr:hypothetical protein [Pilimelia terevasa]GGK32174.1 hypothetical protein GCM10010124_26210 [Pilimelia terevasa]
MDLHFLGAREFFLLAADCRDAGRKDLERELQRGLTGAVAPTRQAIKTAAGKAMPRAGGYAGLLVPVLNVAARKSSAIGIRLVVSAKGETEQRDVRALDAGTLRHPVHGRSRYSRKAGRRVSNPWAITDIPAGFASKTFERQADAIVVRLGDAVQAVADKIAGG